MTTGVLPSGYTRQTYAQMSDEELARITAAGNDDAFAILYERYTPYLLEFIRRALPNRMLVEDIVQDTFVQVLSCRHKLADCRSFASYVSSICRNRLRDIYKRRSFRKEYRLFDANIDALRLEAEAETVVIAQENCSMLSQALSGLSFGDRQLLIWRYVKELSYREIGQHLGLNANAAKTRGHRAHNSLAKALAEFPID